MGFGRLLNVKGPRRRIARAIIHVFAFSTLCLPLHLLLEPHGHGWEDPGASTPAQHHEDHHSEKESSGNDPHWASDHVLDRVVVRSDRPANDVMVIDWLVPQPLSPSRRSGTRRRIREASSPSPPFALGASPSRAPPPFI